MKNSSPVYELAIPLGVAGLATGIGFLVFPYFDLANLVMIYLLGTLMVALRGHRGPAAFSAIVNILAFDFCFVPPRFTLSVADVQYIWTFIVMFLTAMIISHLMIRVREEAEIAREGEKRSAWLMEKAKKAEIDAEAERLRSSLLSSVSHDLKTPLAAIMGSASALVANETFQKNPAQRELLENIQGEAERLAHLVQNLLDATRLESGKVQLKKELFPLEEVLGNVLERLKRLLKQRDVAVRIPEGLPLVPADGVLLEQVLINLLENAVRHTPDQSRIEIFAHIENNAVKVTVTDQGVGLKEEELEKVFDKFYREPHSPGAGLGLAICRAIVNAHGGKIWASNRPGGGAVFSFTLPLRSSS